MLAVAFAAPATAAEGDAFIYQMFAFDESDPDNPIVNPPGYAWDVVATGPATYTNDESPTALVVENVAGGTYTVTATPNAEAEAGSSFDEIWCQRWRSDIPADELDESDYEYFTPANTGGGFQVPVLDGYSTACAEIWSIGEDVPAPNGSVTGAFDVRPSPDLVGAKSDFDIVLQDASGISLGSFNETELVVPPGTYTPLVVASATAQAGFDIDAWDRSSWRCSSVQTGPFEVTYGASFTVPSGAMVQCSIEIAEHFGDIQLFPPGGTVEGDVNYEWGGVYGESGTPYSFGYEVRLPEPAGGGPDPIRVVVTVRLADNSMPDESFPGAPGWMDASVDPEPGLFAFQADAPMSAGEVREFRFGAILTSDKRPSSPTEVCATAYYEGYERTDCDLVEPVGDGCGDGEDCGGTTPPTTPAPTASVPPTTSQPSGPGGTTPAGTSSPAAPSPGDGSAGNDALAVTDGGGMAPGIALGVVALAAGLGLLAQLRRPATPRRGEPTR
ncbi:hypothetical protein GCM10011490_22060 [Pseudoclavibacter endophyticus]|nr:hypothetical protein GCM10011490_22060 [Pseudoclavibacter endophyticus]